MYLAECSALAAALCWSFGGLLSTTPARTFGAVRFNRIRLVIVSILLISVTLLTGGWKSLDRHDVAILAVSSMIGIFLGDTLLYATLKRLGPRRTGILFTSNAPLTVIIGYFFLHESLPPAALVGCVLIMTGVLLAIFCGTTSLQRHAFEKVQGPVWVGLLLGLAAAACQAVSVLIARPIMASGVDAVAASALRVAIGAAALYLLAFIRPRKVQKDVPKMTVRLMLLTSASGILGMALGMTFLLFALAHGPAGLVSTLSATSPVLILPILWIATGERPAAGAWFGACLAVYGVTCIFAPPSFLHFG